MLNENTKNLLKITGILAAITVSVAVLLAVINTVCAPIIERNTEKEKQEAVCMIFPDADTFESLDDVFADNYPDGLRTLYAVFDNGELLGFCADCAFAGFEDDIEMMIGVDAQNVVRGIRILSISDTPGVGLKVAEDAYLDSFYGMSGKATPEADGITGATYSSKAVISGVNTVLDFCSMIEVTDAGEPDTTVPEDVTGAVPEEGTENE